MTPWDIGLLLVVGESVHKSTCQVRSRHGHSNSKACHFCVQGTYQLFVLKFCFQFLETSTQLRVSFLLFIYFIALFLQFFNLQEMSDIRWNFSNFWKFGADYGWCKWALLHWAEGSTDNFSLSWICFLHHSIWFTATKLSLLSLNRANLHIH